MNAGKNILAFVRDRDSLSQREVNELLSPERVRQTVRKLEELQRDIDAQFIAHEARLADMRATCNRAARENGKLVSVVVRQDIDKVSGEKVDVYEDLPPEEALDVFTARELRWKVRTLRFRGLIDTAMDEAKEAMKASDDERLQRLIEAVETHQREMEGEAEEVDEDLYQVAQQLKTSYA